MNQGNALIGLLLLGALATAYPGVAAIIGGLILLEVLIRRLLVVGVRAHLRRRPGMSLPQKNKTRAAAGAIGLVGCGFVAANGFPVVGWKVTAGIAAMALLYLVVGVAGAHGSRFDAMSVFWWGVVVLSCAALLGFIEGIL